MREGITIQRVEVTEQDLQATPVTTLSLHNLPQTKPWIAMQAEPTDCTLYLPDYKDEAKLRVKLIDAMNGLP